MGGRPEEWSEGTEMVLSVIVWSERVFFLLYIYLESSRFHSAYYQLSSCQRTVRVAFRVLSPTVAFSNPLSVLHVAAKCRSR